MARLRRKNIEAMVWMREQGVRVRAVARVAGCDESTVRYHLRREAEGAEDGRRRQPEAVGPYADVADGWIARQREAVARGERPEAVRRLYEELVDEGYEGSYKAVVRFVRRRMGRPVVRPVRRVELAPGALAQVDWALRRVWIGELGGEVDLSSGRGDTDPRGSEGYRDVVIRWVPGRSRILFQVTEDVVHNPGLGDEGDDLHRGPAFTDQRVGLVDGGGCTVPRSPGSIPVRSLRMCLA